MQTFSAESLVSKTDPFLGRTPRSISRQRGQGTRGQHRRRANLGQGALCEAGVAAHPGRQRAALL